MLLKDGRITGIVSEIYRHNTRERIWIEESIRLVRDKATGKPLYYDGTLRDASRQCVGSSCRIATTRSRRFVLRLPLSASGAP